MTEISSTGRRVQSGGPQMVTENPTLAGQLPEMPEGIPGWQRTDVLVRVIRTTAAGALVAAPHPDSRAAWVPLSKVRIERQFGMNSAPHPLQFCRMPVWLYRRLRLDLMPQTPA